MGEKKKILIIDDDERIQKIIRIQLTKRKTELSFARNTDETDLQLKERKIDLVLLDIKMKDTNGFVLLQNIKKAYPALPVIMLSGFIDKKVLERARALGCDDYITKPVRREKLIESIERIIGEI